MQRKALAADKRHRRRQLQQKTEPTVVANEVFSQTKERFVTKFAAVMQTFPEKSDGALKTEEQLIIGEFFLRVARYADRDSPPLDPVLIGLAILFVNFPNYYIMTKVNPFGVSVLFRAFSFVAATMQVVIDCSESEDDTAEDFLPEATAKNFIFRARLFEDVLNKYENLNARFKGKSPDERAKLRLEALRSEASLDARLLD